MSVDPVAAEGFGRNSDAYERGRPSYPPELVAALVDVLAVGPSSLVVDVAAGTGKLTRLLAGGGARVVAVEPVRAMAARLASAAPGVPVAAGTAEALPIRAGSVDAVTAAQAFHWFSPEEALAELARVLRPGGGLAVVRNERDESSPWVARLSEVIGWHRRDVPRFDPGRLASGLAATGSFTAVQERRFHHGQSLDTEGLLDRVRSVSFVALLPDDERARVLAQVRDLASGQPEPFVLPYRAFLYWCRRR